MIAYEQVSRGERAFVALCLAAVWLLVLAAPLVRDWWERDSGPAEVAGPELVDWELNGWTSGDDVPGPS
jgi:hypothetical protein